MRRERSSTFFWILAACSVMVALIEYRLVAPQTAENNISFLWAVGTRAGAGDTKPVAILQDVGLPTGAQFKMAVKLQKHCFVYVLHSSKNKGDSESEVSWLFPYNKQQFDTDYQIGKRYDIPPDDWYRLRPPSGREMLYLLASTERLSALEALLDASAAAKPEERPRLTVRILAEIRALRQIRPLATSGERPRRMGGTVRGQGGNTDVGDLAVEISAQNFYSKTFTIEHQ